MRDALAIIIAAVCTFAILGLTDVEASLRAWRFALGTDEPALLQDLGLVLLHLQPGLQQDDASWFWLGNYGAWLACYLVLAPFARMRRVAFLVSPAPILFAVAGLGVALLGLMIFLVTAVRLAQSRSAGDVPAVGLGLLTAAWTVPQFEVLLLAAASSLVLIAPRDMLRQHMAAYYIVALTPALLLLTVKAGFSGGAVQRAWPAEPALLAAAPPVLIGVVAAANGRLGGARNVAPMAVCLAAAAFFSGAMAPFFAIALAGLAATYIALEHGPPGMEIGQSLAITVAAFAYHGHITEPWPNLLSRISLAALIG